MSSTPKTREEIADEVMGIGVPFALSPTPPPAWARRNLSGLAPAVSFALVFACGALVAMAADRYRDFPGDASSPTSQIVPDAPGAGAPDPDTAPRPKTRRAAPEHATTPDGADAAEAALPVVEAATRPVRPAVPPRVRTPGAGARSAATPAPAATSRATRWSTGDPEAGAMPRSLDDLLDGALGQPPATTVTAAAALPTAPTRHQVLTTLRALEGEVRMCGEGATGIVNASLVVAGPSGQVTSVRVLGDFAGTDVGRCASRVVASARFPHFSRERLEISFPYRL